MKLVLSCASKIYSVEINNDKEVTNSDGEKNASSHEKNTVSSNPAKISTLGSLKDHICSLCDVAPNAVKIIHRGRILNGDDSVPLSFFNFKESDKLLVLGKGSSMQTDAGWELLVDFERHTSDVPKIYAKNEGDLTQLEKNFLKDPERREYTKIVDRRLKGFAENCMKLLEKLDGLPIISDNTEERQAIRNREKRKFLVRGLQDALNKNDKLMTRLTDYLSRIENPENSQ